MSFTVLPIQYPESRKQFYMSQIICCLSNSDAPLRFPRRFPNSQLIPFIFMFSSRSAVFFQMNIICTLKFLVFSMNIDPFSVTAGPALRRAGKPEPIPAILGPGWRGLHPGQHQSPVYCRATTERQTGIHTHRLHAV